MNIHVHPVSLCRRRLEELCHKRRKRLLYTSAIPHCGSGQRVFVAGLIAASRRIRTSSGKPMLFVTIEDETGVLEGTLFPEAYRHLRVNLHELGPYLFGGIVEREHGVASLAIRGIDRIVGLPMAPGTNKSG